MRGRRRSVQGPQLPGVGVPLAGRCCCSQLTPARASRPPWRRSRAFCPGSLLGSVVVGLISCPTFFKHRRGGFLATAVSPPGLHPLHRGRLFQTLTGVHNRQVPGEPVFNSSEQLTKHLAWALLPGQGRLPSSVCGPPRVPCGQLVWSVTSGLLQTSSGRHGIQSLFALWTFYC